MYIVPVDYQLARSTSIIDIDGSSSTKVFENIIGKWWRDDESLIAVSQPPGYYYLDIINLDINTGGMSTISHGGCFRINPFGNPAMVGCLTEDDEFRVYDSNTYAVVEYTNFDVHVQSVQYWIAAPDSYPGEAGCGFAP